MKTTAQLRLTAGTFLICWMISFGSVSYFLHQIRNDVGLVNRVGMIRGRTERLVKLELAGQRSDELIKEIDDLMAGLINGDVSLGLPGVREPKVLPQHEVLVKSWHNLKRFIADFRTNSATKDSLIKYSENHWEITNKRMAEIENYAHTRIFYEQLNILIIFALNLLVTLALLLIIYFQQITIKKYLNILANNYPKIKNNISCQTLLTEKQAIAVHQTKILLDQLNHFSQNSIQQAIQFNSMEGEIKALIKTSQQTEKKVLAELAFISDDLEKFAKEIFNLRENTKQIATIAELISELATHTRILALNASMEATRAGEKGKEFALVAKEIRQLAHQIEKAGEKIYLLILQGKQNIKSLVNLIDIIQNNLQKQINIKTEAINEFEKDFTGIDPVFMHSEEITAIAQQQGTIIQETLSKIQEINRIAQESAVSMISAKQEIEDLAKVASNLKAIL